MQYLRCKLREIEEMCLSIDIDIRYVVLLESVYCS